MNSTSPPHRVVVGITGASGALYAQRLVQLLLAAEVETHLVVSLVGQRLLSDELDMTGLDLESLASAPAGSGVPKLLIHHNYRDVGACLASGSFQHDGMIIIPCSSNTLSAVATGAASNLLHRAAYVTLKERRKLILVHREMPLTATDLRNMLAVTEMGGIIAPASPGYYMQPKSVQDLVDFVAGRCLDLLRVTHTLNVRWQEDNSGT